MIKKGLYGLYKGKEYHIVKKQNSDILIVTFNESYIDSSFIHDDDIYIKKVAKEELSDLFKVTTHAIYRGSKFVIAAGDDNSEKLTLWGGFEDAKRFPEMEQVAMDEFKMDVPVSDVEFIERRKPYNIEQL